MGRDRKRCWAKVNVDFRTSTVLIETRSMTYVISRDQEYICLALGEETICVILRHRKGLIIREHYLENGIVIRETYRTCEREGKELLREFEKLAEIILDNASIAKLPRA